MPTSTYRSTFFVESSGAVLFRLCPAPRQICILHFFPSDEYVLAKSRRNVGEDIRTTAVREVREETGRACELLPVRMKTRAPPPRPPRADDGKGDAKGDGDVEDVEDVPRMFERIVEPFHLQIRRLNGKREVEEGGGGG